MYTAESLEYCIYVGLVQAISNQRQRLTCSVYIQPSAAIKKFIFSDNISLTVILNVLSWVLHCSVQNSAGAS